MRYLLDEWYAAAFCDEVGSTPLLRTLLEQPVVMFRGESGKAVALHDRCPHRFAPLHRGQVIGDSLRCPYHGLQYGDGGGCVHNPIGDGRIPRAAKAAAYPLAERDGIVWLWFGEQPADESKIRRWPEFSDSQRWSCVQGYMPVAADHGLVADNLLDLSHAEFLHPNLATPGFNRRTQYTMEQDGESVIARNWRPGEPITNLFRLAYGEGAPSHVDHRSIVRWNPPSTLHLEVGVTRCGGATSEGPTMLQAHLVTPAERGHCHYFWKAARDFERDDEAFSRRLQSTIQSAFETEDKPMIEAQARYMGDATLEDLRPVLLPTDSASMRARRVLRLRIESQSAR